ncbi:hypothetical protein [Streptomyces hydrogenans]|uniref:Uncharacterized protein n=1 Tax=Streptomyces hydrogenans TaxID=1873719 RepID=A0ABQ3PP25_9ACTN|nr:hypothetical protein GCM10018784_16070 [Streptomyces hydrogenans]GHI26772.1 hypothetical protein Shyd_81430 [Streptomyces hydrogenans]
MPASSALQVDALVRPEPLREIEAFALVPAGRPEERPEEGRAELRLIR